MNSTVHSPPVSANSRSTSQLVTANYEALRYTAPHNNSLRNTFNITLYLQPTFSMKFISHLCCMSSPFHPTIPTSYIRFFLRHELSETPHPTHSATPQMD